MHCVICEHTHRTQIEKAILNAPTTDTLEKLADEYKVEVKDLQVHALLHSPMGVSTEQVDQNSIARQSKIRELDMLLASANEYMVTLQTVGDKIKDSAKNFEMVEFSRSVSKSVVDLYLGSGNELRQSIKAIVDMNEMLNGPKDGGMSGLQALAKAIRGSLDD